MRKFFTFLLALVASIGMSWAAPAIAVNGKLPGAFSVSPTKVVYFSQGNLQFTRTSTSVAWSTGKFSFMDNQYDYIETNEYPYCTDDYANKTAIGLFGWATSNLNTPVANTNYLPTNTNTTNTSYGSGITTENINWATAHANYDWGANTGDLGTGWRTLTADEWTYLFNTRTVNGGTGSGKSYTLGQSVNGKPGVVLYPDNYTGATYTTGSDWSTFEDKGCVFLPTAGYRDGTWVSDVGLGGFYWSSTSASYKNAYYVYTSSFYVTPAYTYRRDRGCSVRLVSDTPPIVNYTITFKNYDGTTLQSGEVVKGATPSYTGTTPVKPSTAAYSYTFSGWSPTIVAATANATYTAQFSQAPNQETVNDVEALVNAIGTVTYPDSNDKITAARDAYNALTDDQKALVGPADLAALEEAEARYAYLTPLQLVPYEDPKTPLTYYCTFYDGNRLMQLPENVEAYVAYVQGDAMMMQYIAGSGDILPKATPVIFLSAEEHFTLLPQDEGAVDLSEVENDLEGVDAATPIASIDGLTQENCYVISGTAEYGVGFYRINSNELKAHKAYVRYNAPNSGNSAPKRLRFVFNQEQTATGMENVQSDKVQCTKVIENGRLIIIKNGIKYNAQGQEIEN